MHTFNTFQVLCPQVHYTNPMALEGLTPLDLHPMLRHINLTVDPSGRLLKVGHSPCLLNCLFLQGLICTKLKFSWTYLVSYIYSRAYVRGPWCLNGLRDSGLKAYVRGPWCLNGLRDSGLRDSGLRAYVRGPWCLNGLRDSGLRDSGLRAYVRGPWCLNGLRDSGLRDSGLSGLSISGTWNVLSIIWRSWVRTLVGSSLGCIALLSDLYLEFGVWSFVLFNDAWSQKGHSASNTTVILASSYLLLLFNTITYYHHFRDHFLTFISITKELYLEQKDICTRTHFTQGLFTQRFICRWVCI